MVAKNLEDSELCSWKVIDAIRGDLVKGPCPLSHAKEKTEAKDSEE